MPQAQPSPKPINNNSLRDNWFDALEELGFDDPDNQKIPEEFKTDEWWKKRWL